MIPILFYIVFFIAASTFLVSHGDARPVELAQLQISLSIFMITFSSGLIFILAFFQGRLLEPYFTLKAILGGILLVSIFLLCILLFILWLLDRYDKDTGLYADFFFKAFLFFIVLFFILLYFFMFTLCFL